MADDPTLDLPGLSAPSALDSPLEKAARTTIAALVDDGVLDLEGRDALAAQLVLTLCKAAEAGSRSGRASAVAMSAAQVLACLDRLDPKDEGGDDGDDPFAALVEEFRKAGGGAPVRDPAQS